jgi:hypothetical protein
MAHTLIVTKRPGEAPMERLLTQQRKDGTGPSGSSVRVGWFCIALVWNGNNY